VSFKLRPHKLFPGAIVPVFSNEDIQEMEVDDITMLVLWAQGHHLPMGEPEISALYFLYDKNYGEVFGHLLDMEGQ
jgi:hypothetical protein